jgi:hypothetical protein
MNKTILTEIIYYSLFGKKFIKDKIIIDLLPKNTFGVFSTIRRHNKLQKWPVDIHGCIGYWSNDFSILSQTQLYEKLLSVSHDSMWNDNRKTYFDSIYNDTKSYLEIEFMLYPKYEIDNNGNIPKLNKKYDNSKYGIIVKDDNGYRATYLPNVFNNISWKEITNSVKQKAGITNNKVSYYAYKIKKIRKRIIDILKDGIFGYYSIKYYTQFLLSNAIYTKEFPFPYVIKNNEIIYSNEQVRNISCFNELINYYTLYNDLLTNTQLNKIKNIILSYLKNINNYSSQALSFLGNTITFFKINNNLKKQFCTKLKNSLTKAENEFEKPELIIGLKDANCDINYEEIIKTIYFDEKSSIFHMNWVIQTFSKFNIKLKNKLIKIFIKKVNTIINNIDNEETNSIAVSFEACSFLLYNNKILNYAFQLWISLEKRRTYNMLYSFINNNESRIDISGHINNGFYNINLFYK